VDRKDPVRADELTKLIAANVLGLRTQRRLSGATLSRQVRELGAKTWTDSTISKLETGRRESVSVTELFALAIALDVPVPRLVADPRGTKAVPVAQGRELSSWTALLWLAGVARPDTKISGTTYGHLDRLIQLGTELAEACSLVLPHLGDGLTLPDLSGVREGTVRGYVEAIADRLRSIQSQGAALPGVPDRIVRAAQRLDIELPGHAEVVT
jgi:transcriptional regulator with XRE-family HTH domain